MARGFSGTDIVNFGTGGGVGANHAWSVAARIFPTAPGGSQTIIGKRDSFAGGENQFTLGLGGSAMAAATDGAYFISAETVTQNIWNHVCFSGQASGGAGYVGTAPITFSSGTRNLSGDWDSGTNTDQVLSVGRLSAEGEQFVGYIAEVGVWDAALTSGEMLAFVSGYSPLLIRTSNLVHYFPIIGRAFPEIDLVGGLSGTITGTTTQAHPRIIMPARRRIGSPSIVYVIARPTADNIDGGWTNELGSNVNLFASIDEAVLDDADYIRSEDNPTTDLVRVKLESIGSVQEPFRVVYRYKKQGAATIDLTARLIENTTTIAEWAHTDISTSFVTATQTLTTPEFEAITDFTDLYLEFEANP